MTDCFISGEYEKMFMLFDKTLQEYIPLSSLKRIAVDTLSPLGKFISLEKICRDRKIRCVYYSYLRYEKLGLCIKFVLNGNEINGLWLSYYELKNM